MLDESRPVVARGPRRWRCVGTPRVRAQCGRLSEGMYMRVRGRPNVRSVTVSRLRSLRDSLYASCCVGPVGRRASVGRVPQAVREARDERRRPDALRPVEPLVGGRKAHGRAARPDPALERAAHLGVGQRGLHHCQ